jgi:predicted secreted protein
MHSELLLESKDAAKFSETLGRLQQMKVALGSVSQLPSDSTRREVEEAATREAIKAFERRAEVVAQSLKKTYRIKSLNIQQAGNQPPIMQMRSNRALLIAADAAPAPVEAGESLLTVNINGQIELSD